MCTSVDLNNIVWSLRLPVVILKTEQTHSGIELDYSNFSSSRRWVSLISVFSNAAGDEMSSEDDNYLLSHTKFCACYTNKITHSAFMHLE